MKPILSRHAALLLFAVVVAVWGSNWAVTKIVVQSVSPLWASAIRSAIATVALLALLRGARAIGAAAPRRRSGHPHRRHPSHGRLRGADGVRPATGPGRALDRARLYHAAVGRALRLAVPARAGGAIATGGDRIGPRRPRHHVQSAGVRLERPQCIDRQRPDPAGGAVLGGQHPVCARASVDIVAVSTGVLAGAACHRRCCRCWHWRSTACR